MKFRAQNLMWPIFLVDKPNDRQEIDSMPGVSRMGVDTMMQELEKLAPLGLKSVLLFSVTDLPKVGILSKSKIDKYLTDRSTTKHLQGYAVSSFCILYQL